MNEAGGWTIDRLAGLIDLFTTLDRKLIGALDSLEEMRARMETIDSLGARGDELITDLMKRMDVLDERLHRDMDEVKAALLAKIGEVDLAELGPRVERLEQAVFNIERATVNLDRAVEGGVELLPDFVTKRMKSEGRKKAPSPTAEEGPE